MLGKRPKYSLGANRIRGTFLINISNKNLPGKKVYSSNNINRKE